MIKIGVHIEYFYIKCLGLLFILQLGLIDWNCWVMDSYLISWYYLGLNQIGYLEFKIGVKVFKTLLMVTQALTFAVNDESIVI